MGLKASRSVRKSQVRGQEAYSSFFPKGHYPTPAGISWPCPLSVPSFCLHGLHPARQASGLTSERENTSEVAVYLARFQNQEAARERGAEAPSWAGHNLGSGGRTHRCLRFAISRKRGLGSGFPPPPIATQHLTAPGSGPARTLGSHSVRRSYSEATDGVSPGSRPENRIAQGSVLSSIILTELGSESGAKNQNRKPAYAGGAGCGKTNTLSHGVQPSPSEYVSETRS